MANQTQRNNNNQEETYKVTFHPKGGVHKNGCFTEEGRNIEYTRETGVSLYITCFNLTHKKIWGNLDRQTMQQDSTEELENIDTEHLEGTGFIDSSKKLGEQYLSFLGSNKKHSTVKISINKGGKNEKRPIKLLPIRADKDFKIEECFILDIQFDEKTFHELRDTLQDNPNQSVQIWVNLDRMRGLYTTWSLLPSEGRVLKFMDRSTNIPNSSDIPTEFGCVSYESEDLPFSIIVGPRQQPSEDSIESQAYELDFLRPPLSPNPLIALKEKTIFFPDIDKIEKNAAKYIMNGPRHDKIDRLWLKLTLETSVAQFVHKMIIKDKVTGRKSKLDQAHHILRSTWLGATFSVIAYMLIGIIIVAVLSYLFPKISNYIVIIGGGGVFAIGIYFLVLTILARLRHGKQLRRNAKNLIDQVEIGIKVLSKHYGGGPIAIKDFCRDVEELRSKGFILPQTLYGLLHILERENKTII